MGQEKRRSGFIPDGHCETIKFPKVAQSLYKPWSVADGCSDGGSIGNRKIIT